MEDWRKIDTRWVRQRDPDHKSEWYFAEQSELLVWRSKKSREIVRFELSWEPRVPRQEFDRYFVRWSGDWVCGTVDLGDRSGKHKMAPIVNELPDRMEEIQRLAVDYLISKGLKLSTEVRAFVMEKLRLP